MTQETNDDGIFVEVGDTIAIAFLTKKCMLWMHMIVGMPITHNQLACRMNEHACLYINVLAAIKDGTMARVGEGHWLIQIHIPA